MNIRERVAGAAIGLLIAIATTYPAVALPKVNVDAAAGATAGVTGAVGGAAAGVGGAVSGAVGGAVSGVGGIAGGVAGSAAAGVGAAAGAAGLSDGTGGGGFGRLSGPSMTMTDAAGFGSNFMGGLAFPSGSIFNGSANKSLSELASLEARQDVVGTLQAVSGNTITVRLKDGSRRTLTATADQVATLRAFVGKEISLRSADGVHVTTIVGRNDAVRGIVTAMIGSTVTFVTRNGELLSVTLPNGAPTGLRVGATVIALSNDFGKTFRLSPLSISPMSILGNVYLGTVSGLSPNAVTLGLGPSQQQFRIDAALSAVLHRLRGVSVAAVSTDGVHITSLLTGSTLSNLVANSRSGAKLQAGRVRATVVALAHGRMTAQLPNGDLVSYLTNGPANAALRLRVPITITPLDNVHARITAGAHVLNVADADACVTVNAHCRGSMSGTAIGVSPTTLTVRFPNGDARTFLGAVAPLGVDARVPVTITPLNSVTARVVANGRVANLVDAHACVTINAGCASVPATVVGAGPSNVQVRLPSGDVTNLQGGATPLGVSANVPIIVQPLDSTHAVVAANGTALNMVDAAICVTLNASCPANSVTTGGSLIPPTAAARGTVGAQAGNVASSTTHACINLNTVGCRRNGTGGTVTGPQGILVASNNTTAAGQNVKAHACATINLPGCAHVNTPSGNGGIVSGGAAGNAAGNAGSNNATGAGCVSINGGTCIASVPTGGGNTGGGNNGGSNNGGTNSGGGNTPNVGGPGNGTPGNGGPGTGGPGSGGPGNGGPEFGAGGGNYIPMLFPGIIAAMNSPATCSEDGQVAINVSDYTSGRGIGDATVQLVGAVNPQWTTSADGTVRFLRLPNGTYHILVSRSGYATLRSPDFHVDCLAASHLSARLAHNSRVEAVSITRAPRITANTLRMELVRPTSTCVTVKHTQVHTAVSYVHHVYHRVTTRRTVRKFGCAH